MTKESKDKRNGVLIKIYLFILFVAGVILGFSYLSTNKEDITAVDVLLDNNIDPQTKKYSAMRLV